MKIHIISNSLKTHSGFSVAAKYIALGLKELGHEISMSSIQTTYLPEFSYGITQFPVVTALGEVQQIQNNIMTVQPEIVIYIGSMYGEESIYGKIFPKTIINASLEGRGVPKYMVNDLNNIVKNGGKVVPYCQFCYNEMKKAGINVNHYIYYGFNNKIFYPIETKDLDLTSKYCLYSTDLGKEIIDPRILSKQKCYECNLDIHNQMKCQYYKEETVSITKFVKDNQNNVLKQQGWLQYEGIPISKLKDVFKGKFIYIFVGANHTYRKAIDRLLQSYSILVNKSRLLKDKTYLHLHTVPFSNTGIKNIPEMVEKLGIEDNVTFSYGNWSEQSLSTLYNIADCGVSASKSEAFCLPIIEGMSTGLPYICPDSTSMTELVGNDKDKTKNRGLLAKIDTWHMANDDIEMALVSVEDLALKMEEIFNNKKLREQYSKNAIEFTSNYTWKKIVSEWDKLLKECMSGENL